MNPGHPHVYALLSEIGAVLLALGILGRIRVPIRGLADPALPARRASSSATAVCCRCRRARNSSAPAPRSACSCCCSRWGWSTRLTSWYRICVPTPTAGAVDLALGAAPGVAIGFLLGWGATGALVMAGVTMVSSSGIISKVLADLGRTRQPRDAGHPVDPGAGRPRDGLLPPDSDGGAGRGVSFVARRRHRRDRGRHRRGRAAGGDPLQPRAVQPDRGGTGQRGAAAAGARASRCW